jgi:hypothetical protein
LIVFNCVGSGTHGIATSDGENTRCPFCAARWTPDTLIGGKVPAHPPIRARVERTTDPEVLDLEAAEKASRREG